MTTLTGASEQIMACPWCGKTTLEIVSGYKHGDLDRPYFLVLCNDRCAAAGPRAPDRAAAISSWNRVARAVRSAEKWRELAREARPIVDRVTKHGAGKVSVKTERAWLARFAELESAEQSPEPPLS